VHAVHVPLSGASPFSGYVSLKQSRPGEAKHVIPIVLVSTVDDDIDVFDEFGPPVVRRDAHAT
jgi:hypothetical protein